MALKITYERAWTRKKDRLKRSRSSLHLTLSLKSPGISFAAGCLATYLTA